MSEVDSVYRAWLAAEQAAEPTWLATVTRVQGSSYRRPGARVLFSRETVLAGAVSGGCLERDLVRTGPWLTRHGPVARVVDARTDEEAPFTGSGCNGRLELLLEPLTPAADAGLAMLGSELEAERRVAVATVIATDLPHERLGARVLTTTHVSANRIVDAALARTLASVAEAALAVSDFRTTVVASDGTSALVEVLEPPPHLFIFGAGTDAVPLARFAALLGWNVTVCTAAARPEFRDRFVRFARVSERSLRENVYDLSRCARPLAVIMSHDYQQDRAVLGALVASPVRYVGVLGPARRTERLLLEIESDRGTLSSSQKSRIFGPAGLGLGAETPPEIALSIIAEAQASLARAPRGSLRERTGTIHAPLAPALHGELV